MYLIERHIFHRILTLTAVTLCCTILVLLITQILNRVNLLVDSGQTTLVVLKLGALLTPAMFVIIVPIVLLVTITRVMNSMNADSELAIIEAAGGSRSLTARPALALTALATAMCLLASLFAEPWANRQIRDVISEASADVLQVAVRSGTFKAIEPNLFVQISQQRPDGELSGVFIADLRDEDTELLYYAKRGTIVDIQDTSLFILNEGQIHNKDRNTGDISIIRFTSYALDMSSFGPGTGGAFDAPRQRDTGYLLSPDPNDYFVKHKPDSIRKELHRRFSDWLYPMVFGLIGLYFAGSARSNREERIWGLTAAFGVALVVRGIGFITLSGAGFSTVLAFLVYAVPVAAAILFGTLLAMGNEEQLLSRMTDRTLYLLERGRALLRRYRLWPAALSGQGSGGSS